MLPILERITRASSLWQEHESASWTTTAGWQAPNEPGFEFRCSARQHSSPHRQLFWKWKVKVRSQAVKYTASGYTLDREGAKTNSVSAVKRIALGILAAKGAEI